MPMKPDIVILDEAANIMPASPITEIKPWVPWEELDLKKIIQADRKYDLFGTETDEVMSAEESLMRMLHNLWQSEWPQQYYVFWEEKTKQPIFGKEREWMYDWVVVTDVKTIGKNVVQYSINWISQYSILDLKEQTWLPLIYIIPPEEQADQDKLEQQDPQEADPDDSENNQDQNENQEPEDGDQGEQPENTEPSDTEDKNQESENTSAEEKTEDDKQSESTPQEATPESKTSWDEKDDGEEWAKEIVESGAKKVTPEELLTLPKQEFVLAKRSSTLINEDGTEVPNASYHTVKVFDNTQWTSTVTWVAVHDGKLKYFYANEDGRVWQKKHSDYDKNRCLYWIAKASW